MHVPDPPGYSPAFPRSDPHRQPLVPVVGGLRPSGQERLLAFAFRLRPIDIGLNGGHTGFCSIHGCYGLNNRRLRALNLSVLNSLGRLIILKLRLCPSEGSLGLLQRGAIVLVVELDQ